MVGPKYIFIITHIHAVARKFSITQIDWTQWSCQLNTKIINLPNVWSSFLLFHCVLASFARDQTPVHGRLLPTVLLWLSTGVIEKIVGLCLYCQSWTGFIRSTRQTTYIWIQTKSLYQASTVKIVCIYCFSVYNQCYLLDHLCKMFIKQLVARENKNKKQHLIDVDIYISFISVNNLL